MKDIICPNNTHTTLKDSRVCLICGHKSPPKYKEKQPMTSGKQRVLEILQELADQSSPVATLKGVPNPLVKPENIDQALDSIEEVIKEVLGEKETELLDRVEKEIINLSPDDYSLAWTLRQAQNTKLKELRKLSAKNQRGRWESK